MTLSTLELLSIAGAGVSVLFMLVSVVASLKSNRESKLLRYTLGGNKNRTTVPSSDIVDSDFELHTDDAFVKSPLLDTRIDEAKQYLEQQNRSVQFSKISSVALTFSQYIVGGVLATSVMQDALSKEIVSVFGILVLISSLLHQTYRPDIRYRVGLQRVVALRQLIRSAEDDLYAIQEQANDAPSMIQVRRIVSEGISAIESLEIDHLELIGKATDRESSKKPT